MKRDLLKQISNVNLLYFLVFSIYFLVLPIDQIYAQSKTPLKARIPQENRQSNLKSASMLKSATSNAGSKTNTFIYIYKFSHYEK